MDQMKMALDQALSSQKSRRSPKYQSLDWNSEIDQMFNTLLQLFPTRDDFERSVGITIDGVMRAKAEGRIRLITYQAMKYVISMTSPSAPIADPSPLLKELLSVLSNPKFSDKERYEAISLVSRILSSLS